MKGIRRNNYDRYMALKGALWAANNTFVLNLLIPPGIRIRKVFINKLNYRALEKIYEELCNE